MALSDNKAICTFCRAKTAYSGRICGVMIELYLYEY